MLFQLTFQIKESTQSHHSFFWAFSKFILKASIHWVTQDSQKIIDFFQFLTQILIGYSLLLLLVIGSQLYHKAFQGTDSQ